jgi:hypothetical protein
MRGDGTPLGEPLPVDLVELSKQSLEFAVASGEAANHGEHILGDVPGSGFAVHLGGQIVGGISESLGGDGADEEVEVIDDLLYEPLAA